VNFGPLAAEIGSGVWGTPANFNGFRVLAALLHGTPPIFGRAAITLGIGPHSSFKKKCHENTLALHGLQAVDVEIFSPVGAIH